MIGEAVRVIYISGLLVSLFDTSKWSTRKVLCIIMKLEFPWGIDLFSIGCDDGVCCVVLLVRFYAIVGVLFALWSTTNSYRGLISRVISALALFSLLSCYTIYLRFTILSPIYSCSAVFAHIV